MTRARELGTRSGKPIGRPAIPADKLQRIREVYAKGGIGMRPLAKQFGVSFSSIKACLRPGA